MYIIEALKSEKPFKRKHWERYWTEKDLERHVATPLLADILADDWEVEEEKITVTRDQFIEAVTSACEKNNIWVDRDHVWLELLRLQQKP